MFKIIGFSFAMLFALGAFSQEFVGDTNKREVVYHQDFRIDDLIERYSEINKNQLISGYRIQIYSGTRKIANQNRTEALQSFPEIKSVTTYETPDFKVQLGNYRTKLEAEKALLDIREVFKGGFVVKTDIELPPLEIENVKAEKEKEKEIDNLDSQD